VLADVESDEESPRQGHSRRRVLLMGYQAIRDYISEDKKAVCVNE